MSYLAPSGFTLTSILDLDAGTVVAFASNEKDLFLQRGTFEEVRASRTRRPKTTRPSPAQGTRARTKLRA